jgi:hypothetical protein
MKTRPPGFALASSSWLAKRKREIICMPGRAYPVNSGLTILGKRLDAGATFNGDVAKGIGQLKAGQLMKYSSMMLGRYGTSTRTTAAPPCV